MLEAIARRLRLLNDFSVGAKLTFGFGLVLLSTFGVAATAFYSLDRLSDGAQRLRELASIRSQIQQVQVLQKDYALTLSPATAQSVKDNVNSLTQKIKVLSADSTVWGNLFEASGEYLEQFSTYSESLQAVRSARIQMQQMAEVANESFISVFLDRLDSLQLNLEGGKNTGEDPIIFLEQANGLRDKLARVRNSEQSFVLEKNEQFRDDWESNMSDLLSAIEILSLRLGAEEKKSLDAARVALGNYRGAFTRFNDGYVNAQKASTVMKVKADQLASSLVRVTEYLELDIVRGSRLANLQLAGISLLALIAGVIAVLFLRGQIVIPLRQVVHLAGRIANGDLSEEDLHINRKDELGQLLETVRQMLNSLRGLVGRISNGVGRLNHVSSDLIDVIKRSGDIAEQQSEQMEIASAAANQMSASASASAESASAARQAVAQAEEQAQEGDQLVRIANTKMATLTEEMARAAAAMQSLLKESASIGGVLDVIKAIADQTNLLALNAAVEAARAGDYGRGFAVVADEVRSLAKRTQVSTREIEGLIGRLDRITQEAASRLHDSHALTDEAAELTDQVSESLSRIKSAVSSIEEMNCQIGAAAEQQSHVAEQISINMMQIKENTESGVRESQSLSLAKDSLRAVGDELNDAVGIFVT